ncbi:MAG: hypothetical protein AAGF11_05295 [Myxococcota bacterium]
MRPSGEERLDPTSGRPPGALHAPRGPFPWWSSNPDKAWGERWFLGYSLAWMLAVAVVIATGWIHTWNDRGYLLFSLVVGGAAVVGPWAWPGRPGRNRPVWQAWWFKLNAWVLVLVTFGTYFGTHYFFDLMGMRYAFPVSWTWQAKVVGHTSQTVPVFMYPLTQAYFVTYYALAPIALRRLGRSLRLGPWGRLGVALALGYAIAWAETFAMASDALADYFAYADKGRMLRWGSLGYASYFVVGLPLVAQIDEPPDEPPGEQAHEPNRERWPLRAVLVQALAACMLILCLLEVWAQLVGPL